MESDDSIHWWPVDVVPPVLSAGRFIHADASKSANYQHASLCCHLFSYAARVQVDQRTYEVVPGDALVTPVNSGQVFEMAKPGVHWCFRLIPQQQGRNGRKLALRNLYHLGQRSLPARQRIETVIESHHQSGGHSDSPAGLAASLAAQSFLCWLAAGDDENLDQNGRCLEHAILLLTNPECADLAINEVARRVGASQYLLNRLFVARFGITMGSFRAQRMIDHAKWLLESTDLPFQEVARRICSYDIHHFNKLFHRHVGMGPRAWKTSRKPLINCSPRPDVDKRDGN